MVVAVAAVVGCCRHRVRWQSPLVGTVASQPTAFATGGRSRIPIITNTHNILSFWLFSLNLRSWEFFIANLLLCAQRERERLQFN